MTKNKKRGPRPTKRNEVILKLRDKKVATSTELGVQTSFMFTLLQRGIVTRAGKEEKDGKGRKATLWRLSAAGNGKASSLKRKDKIAA